MTRVRGAEAVLLPRGRVVSRPDPPDRVHMLTVCRLGAGLSPTRSRAKLHRHRPRRCNEDGREPFDVAGDTKFVQTQQDFAEEGARLEPREMGAEAEVRSAAAERLVIVGRSAHVQAIGIWEHLGIAVGGAVVHHDLVAFAQPLAA